jgi:hypothetical protein
MIQHELEQTVVLLHGVICHGWPPLSNISTLKIANPGKAA